MAGGGDMMMILVVGAIALGGLFLINQSGGLGSIMGGGAAPAPAEPAPTDGEQPPEDGDDQGPYERYGFESGPYGTTYKYETRIVNGVPMTVAVGPGGRLIPAGPVGGPIPPIGPGPFAPPPRFPPGPGPGPGPSPCAKFCIPGPFSDPVKCRQCRDAMGITATATARSHYASYPGNARRYKYGQTGLNPHPNERAIERAGPHAKAFYGGGCGCR